MKIGSFLTASQNSKQLSHSDDDGENQVWYNASQGFDNGEEESEGIWWDSKVEIVGETIWFFFRVSLSKFSLEALSQSWVKGVFILEWERNVKRQVLQNRGGSRLDLAAWLSREFQSRDNRMASCPVLSCSAPASMTVHLPACLARVQILAGWSRESSRESQPRHSVFLHTLEQSSLYLTHYPYNKPT